MILHNQKYKNLIKYHLDPLQKKKYFLMFYFLYDLYSMIAYFQTFLSLNQSFILTLLLFLRDNQYLSAMMYLSCNHIYAEQSQFCFFCSFNQYLTFQEKFSNGQTQLRNFLVKNQTISKLYLFKHSLMASKNHSNFIVAPSFLTIEYTIIDFQVILKVKKLNCQD